MTRKASTKTSRNVRELAFIEQFLLDGISTQAAIRAGYSAKTAHVTGCKLLKKHKAVIDAKLAEQKAALRKTIGVTKERIIKELACIGFMDAADFFDSFGNPIAIPELTQKARRALAGFEFTEDYLGVKQDDGTKKVEASGYTKKYKLGDKIRSLELISKLLGFLNEKDKGLKDSMTLEELILGSMDLDDDDKEKKKK